MGSCSALLKPMRNIATKEGSSYDKKLDQLKIKYSSTMKVMIAKQKRCYGCKSAEYKKMVLVLSLLQSPSNRTNFPPILSVLCAVEGQIKAWKQDLQVC